MTKRTEPISPIEICLSFSLSLSHCTRRNRKLTRFPGIFHYRQDNHVARVHRSEIIPAVSRTGHSRILLSRIPAIFFPSTPFFSLPSLHHLLATDELRRNRRNSIPRGKDEPLRSPFVHHLASRDERATFVEQPFHERRTNVRKRDRKYMPV